MNMFLKKYYSKDEIIIVPKIKSQKKKKVRKT